MMKQYSAHPAIAAEQLPTPEASTTKKPSKFTQHRRNKYSTTSTATAAATSTTSNATATTATSTSISTSLLLTKSKSPSKLKKFFRYDMKTNHKNDHLKNDKNKDNANDNEEIYKHYNDYNINNSSSRSSSSFKHNNNNNDSNDNTNILNDNSDNSIIIQRINNNNNSKELNSSCGNETEQSETISPATTASTTTAALAALAKMNKTESGLTKDCHNQSTDEVDSSLSLNSRSRKASFSQSNDHNTSIATETTAPLASKSLSINNENLSIDEIDAIQNRFNRSSSINSTHQQRFPFDSTRPHQHQHHHHHHNPHPHFIQKPGKTNHLPSEQSNSFIHDECSSVLSSNLSSPAPSTVSTPLSSPLRLPQQLQHVQHQHCCHKLATGVPFPTATATSTATATATATATSTPNTSQSPINSTSNSNSTSTPNSTHTHSHSHSHSYHQHQPHQQQQQQQQQQQHHHHLHNHHHHHHNHHTPNSTAAPSPAVCKKWQKFDPRLGPSPYRQLLPIALCILSFATVFATLIVYMDTTEIRHQQFRLNMSRDYDLSDVAQDNPTLIAFLRQFHIPKYSMHFLKNRDTQSGGSSSISSSSSSSISSSSRSSSSSSSSTNVNNNNNNVVDQHLNFSAHHDELTPAMAYYVADLVGNKPNGAVIQSLTGSVGQLLTAPWLAETLNWMGVIVEPEPRRYFTLGKQNADRPKMQIVHACVSPKPYPKEITIHYENTDVRINSLHDQETSCFNSRVKCFPLYAIMLACDRVEYDLLSLGVLGQELEILETLPFDKVKIEVISIHLPDDQSDIRAYIQTITKFLNSKSYTMQKKIGRNYFYRRNNFSSMRTRKKDIFLLKTP